MYFYAKITANNYFYFGDLTISIILNLTLNILSILRKTVTLDFLIKKYYFYMNIKRNTH